MSNHPSYVKNCADLLTEAELTAVSNWLKNDNPFITSISYVEGTPIITVDGHTDVVWVHSDLDGIKILSDDGLKLLHMEA